MISIDTPIGTICRVIANSSNDKHGFKIGQEVIIKKLDLVDNMFTAYSLDGLSYYDMFLSELELIESPSPLASLFSHSKLFSQ